MLEQPAKELVIRASKELVNSELIARTWGNISCRIDSNTFAITPSGRSYHTLTPEEVVLCKVEDSSYEGDIKPSSEKGIHALIYRTYPNINFVIHTHQPKASAVSTLNLKEMPVVNDTLLGSFVPIAAYGLPGTKKLRDNIGKALQSKLYKQANSQYISFTGHAVIMANHGALMFGHTYDETFTTAKQLEDACTEFIHNEYLKKSGASNYISEDFYQYFVTSLSGKNLQIHKNFIQPSYSERLMDGFLYHTGEVETKYLFTDTSLSVSARIHKEIYKNRKDISFIINNNHPCLLAITEANIGLRPLLDDFAQIVGKNVGRSENSTPANILKALHGRYGVLVPDLGAICCAPTLTDAQAVSVVMQKDAYAQISSQLFGGSHSISEFDCRLMHFVYTKSYAKKAKNR